MKFGDKLIELRKKNGYSQEELAEKLGVSRQSVSKWESNNTYPETDKIIQIANLFDCSMDDLINDKVTDIESSLRKNKNNIEKIWKSLLEFITNTVEMFSRMSFSQGFKCIIELLILALLLNIGGTIVCDSAASIIANIFSFLSAERILIIREVLESIFHLIWFIIALIAIVHTFKIRHLNNFETEKEKEIEKEIKVDENADKKSAGKVEKKYNDKPAEFLGTLAQIVIVFIKFIAFWILISFVFTAIGLLVSSVIVFAHIPIHTLFLWIALLLVAGTIVSIQIVIVLISFIFDKKFNVLANLIVFVACIILSGVSIGMIALTAKSIEYVTDGSVFKPKTQTIELEYKDNLVLESQGEGENISYQYIIDNSIEGNKIIASREVDTKYFKINKYETELDQMPIICISQDDNGSFMKYYNLFINNLKKNKIYTFGDYGNDPLIIRANEDTINKLIDNQRKLWLIEEERLDNQINVTVHDDKVFFPHGIEGKYNAIDDTITYEDEDYTCKKEVESTKYGERIIYTCDYIEED